MGDLGVGAGAEDPVVVEEAAPVVQMAPEATVAVRIVHLVRYRNRTRSRPQQFSVFAIRFCDKPDMSRPAKLVPHLMREWAIQATQTQWRADARLLDGPVPSHAQDRAMTGRGYFVGAMLGVNFWTRMPVSTSPV